MQTAILLSALLCLSHGGLVPPPPGDGAAQQLEPAALTGCTDGQLLLVDPATGVDTSAPSEAYGILMVCHNNRFGFVCDSGAVFNDHAADALCRSFGEPAGSSGWYSGLLPATKADLLSSPANLDGVSCPTAIANWTAGDCTVPPLGPAAACVASRDAVSIVCDARDRTRAIGIPSSLCSPQEERTFRLVNTLDHLGPAGSAGRVEICHTGAWGSICDDNPRVETGHMICKQLGFSRGAFWSEALAYYGEMPATDPIWLELSCPPTATSLLECNHAGWNAHNCQHTEDWSLACIPEPRGADFLSPDCTTAPQGSLRLVDPTDGRLDTTKMGFGVLEYCHNNTYGHICDDGIWPPTGAGNDRTTGDAICRQLGFPLGVDRLWRSESPRHVASYKAQSLDPPQTPPATLGFWLDDVVCPLAAASLAECTHLPFGMNNCNPSEVLSIACKGHRAAFLNTTALAVSQAPPPRNCGGYGPEYTGQPLNLQLELQTATTGIVTGCFGGFRYAMCAPRVSSFWESSNPAADALCGAASSKLASSRLVATPLALGIAEPAADTQPRFDLVCPPGPDSEFPWIVGTLTDCIFLDTANTLHFSCSDSAAILCAPKLPAITTPVDCSGDDGIQFEDFDAQICLEDRSDLIKRLDRAEKLIDALMEIALSNGHDRTMAVLQGRDLAG